MTGGFLSRARSSPAMIAKAEAEGKRKQILRALVGLAAEGDYRDVTVAHIVRAAKVGRGMFYRHFRSKDDAFPAALAWAAEELTAAMDAASTPEMALEAVAATVNHEPKLVRFLLVEGRCGSSYEEVLSAGIAVSGLLSPMSDLIVGGIEAVIRGRLLAGEPVDSRELAINAAPFYSAGR